MIKLKEGVIGSTDKMKIHKEIKYKTLYLLSQTSARDLLEKYRHRGLKGNDMFLVSYQNSGSTWLRNLIYESVTGKNPNKTEEREKSKREFSMVGKHKNMKPIINKKSRIIKSHSPYRKEYEGKKIIYIVRDPRDVAISKYEKRKKNVGDVNPENNEIDKFIRGKMVSEGLWSEHVDSWLNAKKQNKVDLHLVKYEDLKKNTEKELKEILEYLDVDFTERDIKKAIEDNSVKKMKKKYPDVRKGEAGSWKEELSEKQAKKIENKFRETMKVLGYLDN